MGYPFPVDTARLTAIAVAYQNKGMIADKVAPIIKVDDETFKYNIYGKEKFKVPETTVGARGEVNEVFFASSEKEASTTDHGLQTKIPKKHIERAKKVNNDIVGARTESLTEIITLRREVETANLIQNVNNYSADNVQVLSGSSMFSDITSDPVRAILTAKENSLVDFNICSMGSVVWRYLSLHPKMIKHFYGENATAGEITLTAFKDKFEFEDVLVGKAFVNTAEFGQPASMQRAWGNDFAMQHRNKLATNLEGTTFAYTASWQPDGVERIVATNELKKGDFGIDGGLQVVIGEHKKVLATAEDFGYIFKNVTPLTFS